MNINEVFDLAIQAEQNLSVCYDEMNLTFQKESFSDEFMALSKEEIDHRNLLIAGKNYLAEAPDALGKDINGIEILKSGLKKASRLIDDVRNNDTDLEAALNELVELEILFEKFHLKSIADVKEPSLKKLFGALSLGDKLHKARLMNILSRFLNRDQINK